MSALDPRLGNPEWVDNWTVGTGLRFELMEVATKRVLLCQDEVTADEIASIDPHDGFMHVLAGSARPDLSFFGRSPGADNDGPVDTVELGGRRFSYVARPVAHEALASGAVEMTIEKHHATLYRAGRTLDVLHFGDGTVATPAWGSTDPAVVLTDAMLDVGWSLRRVALNDDLLVTIPNPARVIVLDKAFGFHGPVDIALIELVTQEVSAP